MFGVMTDKGVRTTGFYSVVRHPSYTLEALMFLVMVLRDLNTASNWLAALLLYGFLYWIRSERDENFMSHSNPRYATYQQEVPWKYIPGLI
jgi:protein-S-isoprenylcysteine O-methyltransferase Ste14